MIETFQRYAGTGLILFWFFVAWIYLFIAERKRQNRVLFVYVPAGVLLLFFNPIFYGIMEGLTEEAIYFRFLWLLPMTVVLAYCAVKISNSLKGLRKGVFSVIVVLLIMLSGKLVYTNPLFDRAENFYHVPQEVVEICDAVRVEGREVIVAFPEEFLLYVRQYSPYVCMPYGRETLLVYNELLDLLDDEVVNVEKMAKQAKMYGCHYVVFTKEQAFQGNMKDYSYECFDEVGDYVIYRDTSVYIGLYDEIE